MKVYLSPSTQEHNIGAGKYGTEEQRMNEVVDAMEPDLLRHGFHIKRNRPDMTLMEVVKDSNDWKPDIHVAIHSNAGGGKGAEVLYYSDEGYKLAKCIYDELAALTPWLDRGIKRRLDLYELKYTIAPACIVEIAFHDDPEQAEWIMEHKEDIGKVINKGICKYAGVVWQDDGIQKIPLDVPVQVQNGCTLAPLRAVCEALGATVYYDDRTKEITITQADTILKLKVGGKEIMKIKK
ncbi:MAG: N-acetylmuramoyl-L-alanine amidase [Thermacetogeniaceae bacterium]